VSVSANTGDDALTIDASPADRNGKTSGLVPFTRSYFENTNVTLTAPLEYWYFWMLWRFQRWELDGAAQPAGQNVLEIDTQAWETAKAHAVYKRAGVLSVSSKTVDGVTVLVSPADLDGIASGDTPFDVTFFIGDVFFLEAPLTSGSFKFRRWVVNGAWQPYGQNIVQAQIPVLGEGTAKAIYDLVPSKPPPIPGGRNSPRQ